MFYKEILIASQSLIRSTLVGTLLLSVVALAEADETRSRTVAKPNKNAEMVAEAARLKTFEVIPAKAIKNASPMPTARAIRSIKVTKDFTRGGMVMATIELDGQAKYSYFTLPSPYRLVVDVQNVISDVPDLIQIGMAPLKRVRLGKMDDSVRIVFDGVKPQPFEINDDGSAIRIWFGEPKTAPVLEANRTPMNRVQPSATPMSNALAAGLKPRTTANATNASPKPSVAPSTLNQPKAGVGAPIVSKAAEVNVSTAPVAVSAANRGAVKPVPVQLPTSPKLSAKTIQPRLGVSLLTRKLVPMTKALLVKNDDAPPPPKIVRPKTPAVVKAPVSTEPTRPTTSTTTAQALPSPAPNTAIASNADLNSQLGKKGVTRVVAATPMPITKPATSPTTETPAPVNAPAAAKTIAPTSKPVAATTTTPPVTVVTKSATTEAPASRPREIPQTPANPQTKIFNAADYVRPDFVGEAINLDLRSTAGKVIDIRDFLRFITDTYKVNFVIDQSVRDIPITVTLQSVPWNQAMDALLRANRLGVKVEGSILRVMSQETVALEDRLKQEQTRARQEATPLVTEMVRLKYARASSTGAAGGVGTPGGAAAVASPATGGASTSGAGSTAVGSGLEGIITGRLSTRGKIQADPRTNMLIITDVPENVVAIKEIINQLDVPEPQVEIESRIVIANRNFARDLGVQLGATAVNTGNGSQTSFSTLPGGATLPVGNEPLSGIGAAGATSVLSLTTGLLGTARISAVLSAAETKGNVKTISSPRITALNNQTANIVNGVQIPVQTESNNTLTVTFVTAALRLEITPQINDVGNVLLRVVAENNSVNTAIATRSAPGINTQRAETTVLVPDGGTTIIGGINIDVESNSQQRTPGVSRIPGLGELFKRRTVSRQTDEILFFITPRVYRPLDAQKMTSGPQK
jgi:type IV pilus assembly protein PilQ